MTRPASFLALTLSAAFLVGCDSESTPSTPNATPSPAAATATPTTQSDSKTPSSGSRKLMAPPKRKSL
jgi:hypothetical protein